MNIEAYNDSHLGPVIRLSLRAWEPVFESLAKVMDPEVYREQHPDWRSSQRRAVESVCKAPDDAVWVAVEAHQVVGFAALRLHKEDRMGEIYMIAVDPDFQRRGIATALTDHAFTYFKEAGMTTVMVETGGDPGHAPARRTYESAGFRMLPIARYFRML